MTPPPPWLWKVEATTPNSRFGWSTIINRLPQQAAWKSARNYADKNDGWMVRIHDEGTGEIIHVGKTGAA